MFQVALSRDNTNPIPPLHFAHRHPTIHPFQVQLNNTSYTKSPNPFSTRLSSSFTQPTGDTYVMVISFILDILLWNEESVVPKKKKKVGFETR